jgi:hypothetical protein
MEEVDIWRTAHVLMKQHGADAAFVAAKRADELFAKNDFVGAAVFHRIARAIQDLGRENPVRR